MALTQITEKGIKDGEILNADINASAAIAGTKISPDFGSQGITTTGVISMGNGLTLTGTNPFIDIIDSNNNSDFTVKNDNGTFEIEDKTNSNAVRLAINSSGNVGIGTTSPSHRLDISQDGVAFPSAAGSTVLRVRNSGGSSTISIDSNAGNTAGIQFGDTDASSQGTVLYNHSSNHMQFNTSATERMRIQSNGNVMIGNSAHFTANVAKLDVVHAGANTAPTYVSRFFQETNNTGSDHACIQLRHGAATGTQDATMIDFKNSGGHTHGSIKMDGSSVSFNSTSDYRIKENLVSLSNAITRLKTLKPYRFNYKDNPTKTVDGFLAHEVTAVPEAVTGTKDEVDSDNNPIYQGIDQSKLVPLIVAAVQELIGKVEVLEAA